MAGETSTDLCFKEHRADGKVILAFCDADLLSKIMKFGEVDFEVSESFYGSKKAGPGEIMKKLPGADIVNAVGKKAVGILLEAKLVKKDRILWLDHVPHAQVVRL